ncbi:MAG: hypothetical protein HZB65_01205 [Candidatus Aenigmarchaeota archaeon]|nr:hypothetical protein [Candidatus Aenigmarchaeota archaeon]
MQIKMEIDGWFYKAVVCADCYEEEKEYWYSGAGTIIDKQTTALHMFAFETMHFNKNGECYELDEAIAFYRQKGPFLPYQTTKLVANYGRQKNIYDLAFEEIIKKVAGLEGNEKYLFTFIIPELDAKELVEKGLCSKVPVL